MHTLIKTAMLSLALAVAVPATAFAHVTVTPQEAAIGTRTTFSVSVPNEKEAAVSGLKLAVPARLKEVTPTVHPGWTITTTADGEGNVTAITWSGGTIPAGQRDDLTFRAQTPAKATELIWKATQTYADGTIVTWDQTPTKEESESETSGPYSVTKVNDDLAPGEAASSGSKDSSVGSTLPLVISLLALVLSAFALTRKPK